MAWRHGTPHGIYCSDCRLVAPDHFSPWALPASPNSLPPQACPLAPFQRGNGVSLEVTSPSQHQSLAPSYISSATPVSFTRLTRQKRRYGMDMWDRQRGGQLGLPARKAMLCYKIACHSPSVLLWYFPGDAKKPQPDPGPCQQGDVRIP